jgi:hypothetical protein
MNISYQPKASGKKQNRVKEHLSQLASNIKIRMDENHILMDTINYLCINIKKYRQQLKKLLLNQNKENIRTEINKNILNLKNSNKNVETQKKLLFHKYIKLKNKFYNELEPLNTELKLLNDRKFIIDNIIKKRNFEIERNEKALNLIIGSFIREDKREIFSNNIDIDEDNFINNLDKYQTLLLSKLKDFNKYHNKSEESKKEIDKLKKIIKKLKEKKKLSDEEKNIIYNKKNNNKIINEENNNNNNNKTEEENSIMSDIMNDTINSEYEDEENIEFIPEDKIYKPIILKIKIPKINLKQIEYNKMKFKQEDAEKSLSRELKNFNEFDMKKIIIKDAIKKEKIKNKKLSNKYLNLSKKIKMMENIVKNMEEYNYKLSLSAFRDRKVDIPIKKQLNALSGRNRQIINHKFNFEDKLNNFEQNNFKDDNNNINNK